MERHTEPVGPLRVCWFLRDEGDQQESETALMMEVMLMRSHEAASHGRPERATRWFRCMFPVGRNNKEHASSGLDRPERSGEPRNGPGTQSSAAGAPAGSVRAAAGLRHHRSVSVPGGHPVGKSRGGHRVPDHQHPEVPQAAGPAAGPRAPGLPLLPALSGGLRLGPRPAAAGARDRASTRTRTQLSRRPAPGLGSAEGSFGPGLVPAGVPAWLRVGVGPDGSGSVCGGLVPVSVRSPSQYSRSGSGRSGSVETMWREDRHDPETPEESAGHRRPSVCPGGRPAVTHVLFSHPSEEPNTNTHF